MRDPLPPDGSYLRALNTATARAVASAEPLTSAHRGAPDDVRDAVTAAVAARADDLVALSRDLHAHPEIGFAEHRSVRAVADLLAAHGHHAQVGVGGLDTPIAAQRSHRLPRPRRQK